MYELYGATSLAMGHHTDPAYNKHIFLLEPVTTLPKSIYNTV